MNITILSVNQTTGYDKNNKTYQILDVAFKNNTFGKVEGKKITSYNKAAFDILAVANANESFDVVVEKNKGGFNEWTALTKLSAEAQATKAVTGSTATKSYQYETAEDRAIKQRSIIRQSSLGHAVATLSVGSKGVDPEKVIEVAKQYETYVNSSENFAAGASGFEDVPNFDSKFEPQ